ncbi:MAG: hypothetical protein D3909_15460, partial [Candidatus Electrothrix sp. ATG1]|nr:hypothetical protein [Candidatus Electrothrix sp. ATG1]
MAIITISRGTYAGGKEVASRLAEHLDYPILSREKVLHEIDRDYGIPEKTINNKQPTSHLRIFSTLLSHKMVAIMQNS